MKLKRYKPVYFQIISYLIPIISFGLLSNRLLVNINPSYIQEFSLYLSLVTLTSILELGQQDALILSVSKRTSKKNNDIKLETYLLTLIYNFVIHFTIFSSLYYLISSNVIPNNFNLSLDKFSKLGFSSELLFLNYLNCALFRGLSKYNYSAFFIVAPPLLMAISTLVIVYLNLSPNYILSNAVYILLSCKVFSLFFLFKFMKFKFEINLFLKFLFNPKFVLKNTFNDNLSFNYMSSYFFNSILTTLWTQIPRVFLLGYSPYSASQFVLYQSISGKFNGLGGSIAEITLNNNIYKVQSSLVIFAANFARKYSTFIAFFASVIASFIILPKSTNFIQYISLFVMCTGAIISSTIAPIYFKFIAKKKMFYNTIIQIGTTSSLLILIYFSYLINNKYAFTSIFILTCLSMFFSHIICYVLFEKSKKLLYKS